MSRTMSRRTTSVTTVAGLLMAGLACGPSRSTSTPNTSAAAAETSPGKARPRAVERHLSKERRPAENVRIRATLWDRALLAADAHGVGDPVPGLVPEPPDEVRARLARWSEFYIDGQTTFTVLVELLNRPELEPGQADPIADPSRWKFRLDLGDEVDIEPGHVEVQTLDRYPSRAKGWHWRMAFAVHFPPDLAAAVTKSTDGKRSPPTSATLRIVPPYGDAKRPEFGTWAARHGFALAWRLDGE